MKMSLQTETPVSPAWSSDELSPQKANASGGHAAEGPLVGEQDAWEKLRSPGHTIFRFQDDEVYWLRVAEVLAVNLENGTAELWYYLRSRQHSTKKWHEGSAARRAAARRRIVHLVRVV